MFTVSFQTSVIAITQIFAMGAVGYVLVKRGVIDQAGLKLLSFLTINIGFPLFIFVQILHNLDPVHTRFWWCYPLINISLTMIGITVTHLISLAARQKPRDELLAVASFHNAGYIPLLFIMSLPLGEMASKLYPAVILSIIGFDMCLWTLGVWLLTRAQNPRMELRRIITPPLVAMFGAVGVVLTGSQGIFIEPVLKPVKLLGDSALPIAMFTIGGNLAMTSFRGLDLRKIAGGVGIKILVLPLLVLFALTFLHLDPIMSFVLMLQACMPTSVSLSIISRHYGTKNQDFINQVVFFTHLLCMVTIPVFLGLYGKWVH